jgi:hypothetical protein
MAESYSKQVPMPACPAREHGLPSWLLGNTSGRAAVLIFFLALKAGVAAAATSTICELSMRAIVNGHNVQPRADCLRALGRSDLPPRAAEEVDRLYQDLMRNSILSERVPH